MIDKEGQRIAEMWRNIAHAKRSKDITLLKNVWTLCDVAQGINVPGERVAETAAWLETLKQSADRDYLMGMIDRLCGKE
jgi:hypothetical protein